MIDLPLSTHRMGQDLQMNMTSHRQVIFQLLIITLLDLFDYKIARIGNV